LWRTGGPWRIIGVNAGGSLAGKDSLDASSTRSSCSCRAVFFILAILLLQHDLSVLIRQKADPAIPARGFVLISRTLETTHAMLPRLYISFHSPRRQENVTHEAWGNDSKRFFNNYTVCSVAHVLLFFAALREVKIKSLGNVAFFKKKKPRVYMHTGVHACCL
jgi:hypothetical protein